MFSKFRQVLLLILVIGTQDSQAFVSAVDSTGQRVELLQPAVRIISLAPHTTELLFASGAGEHVVGVVSYSDYPEQARRLTNVGSHQALDYEAIVALKPDLILAWKSGNPPTSLEKLKNMGYPVFITEPRHLTDIPILLREIAKLTQTEGIAEVAANQFSDQLQQLYKRYSNVQPLKVFFQIWQQPLMTISASHIINEVIELCGGVNIFDQQDRLATTVEIESVILRDPDVIIINGQGGQFDRWRQYWQQWSVMQAVKTDSIYQVNPDITSRHTPRLIMGAAHLCGLLDHARGKITSPGISE